MASFNSFGYTHGPLEIPKDWSRVSDQQDPGAKNVNYGQANETLEATFKSVLNTAVSFQKGQQVRGANLDAGDKMIACLNEVNAAINAPVIKPQEASEKTHTGTPANQFTAPTPRP